MKTGPWCTGRVILMVLLTITLAWGLGKDASGQVQQGKNAHPRAKQVLADPGALHQRIKARNMQSLAEVGTTLETVMPATEFWSRYDGRKGQ
jgi:hypothetical protein